MLAIGCFIGSILFSEATRYIQGDGVQTANNSELEENSASNTETSVNERFINQTTTENRVVRTSIQDPRIGPRIPFLFTSFFNSIGNTVFQTNRINRTITNTSSIDITDTPLDITDTPPTNITNTPSNENQNRNTIQIEEKTLWAYNRFKDTKDRTSDTELQNLYAMPSNTTIKRETENLNSGFQKLGAKLLKEALEEKDKPILKSFYKFMNSFPTKLWTSYDWKTSREIRIEFGKKLILQSTSPEDKETIITNFFEEKDHQAIRQILS